LAFCEDGPEEKEKGGRGNEVLEACSSTRTGVLFSKLLVGCWVSGDARFHRAHQCKYKKREARGRTEHSNVSSITPSADL
jgi:hypothetical protein